MATSGRVRRIHKIAGGGEFYDIVRETRSIYGTEEGYRGGSIRGRGRMSRERKDVVGGTMSRQRRNIEEGRMSRKRNGVEEEEGCRGRGRVSRQRKDIEAEEGHRVRDSGARWILRYSWEHE